MATTDTGTIRRARHVGAAGTGSAKYRYKPVVFYGCVFAFTWAFWIAAALTEDTGLAMTLMFLGLCVPAIMAAVMVATSRSAALKREYRDKIVGFGRIRWKNIGAAIALFAGIVAVSILVSAAAGQSLDQFRFTEDFSFSIRGTSALLTIVLASVIEELGWRDYGEDSVAFYTSWFKEAIIFGLLWSAWHIPLVFIDGTYQAGLVELGAGYVANFFIGIVALAFLTTWVYVKNDRSLLACIIFHLFINIMQEKVAMTPETKCIETLVIAAAVIVVVLRNKEMFFETDHVGHLLDD